MQVILDVAKVVEVEPELLTLGSTLLASQKLIANIGFPSPIRFTYHEIECCSKIHGFW
jgi:hypothetical protein